MNEIFCSNVFKSFVSKAERLDVLRSLNLSLPASCTCAIMGASGSGKTTLLSLIGGLEGFDSGEIQVGAHKLHTMDEKKLAIYRSETIGFVFQFHYLLKDFTALENVALPAYLKGAEKKKAWEKAEALLEKVGLADRKNHFPSELSGGERQRTAIARALVNDPILILADEPTGNLDRHNAESVAELMFRLPELSGATVILATHDEALARRAQFVFRLSLGSLEAV